MRRTRGHTLFVVETLRALAAGDRGAPESLQQVVLARLRRVGPATEELLRAGAVLGATVDPATAAAMIGLAPHLAAQRCEVAAAARLLVVAGRSYEFANDLVQEVLYATTPAPTRIAYHRRAAELLDGAPELRRDPRRAGRGLVARGRGAAAGRRAGEPPVRGRRRRAVLAARALAAAEQRRRATEWWPEHIWRRGRSRVVRGEFRRRSTTFGRRWPRPGGPVTPRREMLALRELGGHAGVAVSMAEAPASSATGCASRRGSATAAHEARFLSWLAVLASNRLRFVDALGYARRAVDRGPRPPATRPRWRPGSTG